MRRGLFIVCPSEIYIMMKIVMPGIVSFHLFFHEENVFYRVK